MKIIIIGGVAGGATAAARLRRLDEKAEIVIYEKDDYVSYANCGLPYYIGGTIKERDALFLQTPEGFKRRFNIDVRIKSEVIAIDSEGHTVTLRHVDTGLQETAEYDKLIIATGASAIKPAIPGIENEGIFSLRNVPDTDRIKQFVDMAKPRHAVVVGGGFIGLETAENLHHAGIAVTVVERASQVMGMMDYPMAAQIHNYLRSKEIDLLLNESIQEFVHKPGKVSLKLESGTVLDTDMLLLSIGVRPENRLAKEAGLNIGALGGIAVDKFMQTSNPDIYAIGDATEAINPLTGKPALIPLAGPANKQARIAADNIVFGNARSYDGTIGTAIAKLFDLTVASAGLSEQALKREKIDYYSSISHAGSHAGYYPGALPLTIKINFAPDGKLLGAQAVGFDGVDKRIDLLAQVIRDGGSIYDLQTIEHAYAPPYSSAKDPVNMAGFIAENIVTRRVNIIHYDDISERDANTLLVDVRTTDEFAFGHIDGAINMPVDSLRDRLNELPIDKRIYIYCAVGLRGYIASRILMQNGYIAVFNLSGGYKTYETIAIDKGLHSLPSPRQETIKDDGEIETPADAIVVDACGMQCPGPILALKKHYDSLEHGARLTIKSTDQTFGNDLQSWTKMVGARLVSIDNDGAIITATVEKAASEKSDNIVVGTDTKTLIVFSDDLDKALASFVIANGILATGKKVSIFFTFWGLSVVKKREKPSLSKDIWSKMFGFMLPSDSTRLALSKMNMGGIGSKMMRSIMKRKQIESLESLMQSAIAGGAEMIACSMSMDVMGVAREELLDNVTVGGVATYLERAEKSNLNLFI